MKHEDLARAYNAFFNKTDAGKYFIAHIEESIKTAHEDAEKTPELSRDYTQRAKGLRIVLDHITSVGTEVKKGGRAN